MLDPDLKTRWLAALRSGDYTQTKHRLCDSKGYCCLGVLADLVDHDRWIVQPGETYNDFDIDDEPPVGIKVWGKLGDDDHDNECYLPFDILDYDTQTECSRWNDEKGMSFAEIADKVEQCGDDL